MNADDKKRYALLWERIEALLFSPHGAEEECRWCAHYMNSLRDCWEAGIIPLGKAYPQQDDFSMPLPGFSLSYDFSNWEQGRSRFSIRMSFENVVFACQDIDKCYTPRVELLEPPREPPSDSLLDFYPDTPKREQSLREDTKWVLDRYLMHPCAHVHLVADILDCLRDDHAPYRDVVHEIRLPMGCENPFTALFQYRIQFILGTDKVSTKTRREAERDRLIDMVVNAVIERADHVSSGDLFELNRHGKK